MNFSLYQLISLAIAMMTLLPTAYAASSTSSSSTTSTSTSTGTTHTVTIKNGAFSTSTVNAKVKDSLKFSFDSGATDSIGVMTKNCEFADEKNLISSSAIIRFNQPVEVSFGFVNSCTSNNGLSVTVVSDDSSTPSSTTDSDDISTNTSQGSSPVVGNSVDGYSDDDSAYDETNTGFTTSAMSMIYVPLIMILYRTIA